MNRFIKQKTLVAIVATSIAAMIAGTASAQNTMRCESQNGRRQECRFEGAATVLMSQQLSRESCLEGRSWGVNGNTIWVDNGCRADFILTADNTDNRNGDRRNGGGWDMRGGDRGTQPGRDRTITVVCESNDGQRHRCAADTLGQITLGRQLGRDARCVEGRTWGSDSKGIWVDRGCRGEFLIADNGGTYRDRGPSQAMTTVVCEARGSRRNYCRADTRFGVRLTHEISRDNCVVNKTWGTDRNGLWVSNGCRAEFTMKTRM